MHYSGSSNYVIEVKIEMALHTLVNARNQISFYSAQDFREIFSCVQTKESVDERTARKKKRTAERKERGFYHVLFGHKSITLLQDEISPFKQSKVCSHAVTPQLWHIELSAANPLADSPEGSQCYC
jgi:hypothetical protein